jgi:hypothetical protein
LLGRAVQQSGKVERLHSGRDSSDGGDRRAVCHAIRNVQKEIPDYSSDVRSEKNEMKSEFPWILWFQVYSGQKDRIFMECHWIILKSTGSQVCSRNQKSCSHILYLAGFTSELGIRGIVDLISSLNWEALGRLIVRALSNSRKIERACGRRKWRNGKDEDWYPISVFALGEYPSLSSFENPRRLDWIWKFSPKL